MCVYARFVKSGEISTFVARQPPDRADQARCNQGVLLHNTQRSHRQPDGLAVTAFRSGKIHRIRIAHLEKQWFAAIAERIIQDRFSLGAVYSEISR